jgi:hypothetical protein
MNGEDQCKNKAVLDAESEYTGMNLISIEMMLTRHLHQNTIKKTEMEGKEWKLLTLERMEKSTSNSKLLHSEQRL